MSILQSIVLGFVQGLTEFLPVSSSGHLVFIPKLFGWQDQGLIFDVIVHIGTLAAVVVFFRKKIWKMFLSLGKYFGSNSNAYLDEESIRHRSLFFLILLSIVPAGVAGFWLKDWLGQNIREVWIISASLIFWGIILIFASLYAEKITPEKNKKLNWKNALFISFAQVIALVPGTSRSGITMTAGLFSKLTKKDAAEFSFLMSIPIIALAGLLEIVELYKVGLGDLGLSIYISGFLASVVSGFFAIWLLMKIIQKWSLALFGVYRIVVGVLILIFLV